MNAGCHARVRPLCVRVWAPALGAGARSLATQP